MYVLTLTKVARAQTSQVQGVETVPRTGIKSSRNAQRRATRARIGQKRALAGVGTFRGEVVDALLWRRMLPAKRNG